MRKAARRNRRKQWDAGNTAGGESPRWRQRERIAAREIDLHRPIDDYEILILGALS